MYVPQAQNTSSSRLDSLGTCGYLPQLCKALHAAKPFPDMLSAREYSGYMQEHRGNQR